MLKNEIKEACIRMKDQQQRLKHEEPPLRLRIIGVKDVSDDIQG